jgi:hypothetical protein
MFGQAVAVAVEEGAGHYLDVTNQKAKEKQRSPANKK